MQFTKTTHILLALTGAAFLMGVWTVQARTCCQTGPLSCYWTETSCSGGATVAGDPNCCPTGKWNLTETTM